jgi:hypothetical protein
MERPKEIVDVAQLEAIIDSEVAERISKYPWIKEKFDYLKQTFEQEPLASYEQFASRQLNSAINMIGDSDFSSPLAIAYYSHNSFNPWHLMHGEEGREGIETGRHRRVGRIELTGHQQYQRKDLVAYADNSFIDFTDIIWDCRRQNGRIELEVSEKYLRARYDVNIHQFQQGAFIKRQLDKSLRSAS